MPLTPPSGVGKLSEQIRDMQREIRRARRGRAPGVNRRITSRGTVEWPIRLPAQSASGGTGYIAVWL